MNQPSLEKSQIIVRIAIPADNRLLAEMGARTFFDTFAADNTPENMAAYLAASFSPEKQATELADPSTVFLIAEIAGAAVGYARLRQGKPPAVIAGRRPIEIVRLYATKEWIGHGVGARLMQACLDQATRKGCDTIWLDVWEHNPRAQVFYRKWGFVETGLPATQVFQLGDEAQTDILMQRGL